ncbi:unnamed protein product [Onchocerca ochengi]|uniref:Glutathione S-transferase n=1 Tax=Onchocerca ochengi TaxID=42157 RepID=A0A182EH06_ONCOC|nr:unnamed protein product [Onchocerca ochengi]
MCKKGIEFEVVSAANFQQPPDWFHSNNPEGYVPVLRHDGKLVNHSRVIIEYLDDASSANSILPDEPKLRAKRRFDAKRLESVCDAIRNISFSHRLTGNITRLALELTKAEEMLQSSFYSGEELGLPDIILYPFIQRLYMIQQIIDDDFLNGVFGEYFPRLVDWFTRMRTLPEIQLVQETDIEMNDFMISKGNWNMPVPEVGMSISNL